MRRYLVLALMACVSLAVTAQGRFPQVVSPAADDQLFTLQSGNVTMSINTSKGGKILSLKYGEQEVLSQSRWPESFGSTFWTSPQKEWNWPPVAEFDKQPYTVGQQSAEHLTITSAVNQRLGLSVGKDFAVESGGIIVVTYSIKNEGDEARRVAPWEVTRVANTGGLIFFDAPADSIWPAGLMDFRPACSAVWYTADEAQQNRKVNADGRGWLAYYADGLLLVKTFQDLQPTEPAPGEAEVQVYVNRGRTYIELESQGGYTLLQPGERLTWAVQWHLLPAAAASKEQLIQKVNSIIQQTPKK